MKIVLMKNGKQTRGFSMIDLLVSMATTSLLILGMAQLMCHAILVKRKTDCAVRAVELASQKIEHLRAAAWSDDVQDTSQSEELEDARVNHTFYRKWKIQEVSSDTKKIEMECFAINYPRKIARFMLILSTELGF
jgi:Tfp pilus assembly protein PilV